MKYRLRRDENGEQWISRPNNGGDIGDMQDVVDELNRLLANQVPSWTKCAERQPEVGDKVEVKFRRGAIAVGHLDWMQGHKPDFWNIEGGRWEIEDIVEWRPVPE